MKTTLLTFVALTAFTGLVVAQPAAPAEERNPADGPFQPQVIKAGGTIPPTPTQIVKSHATMDTPVKKCRLTPIFLVKQNNDTSTNNNRIFDVDGARSIKSVYRKTLERGESPPKLFGITSLRTVSSFGCSSRSD